MQLFEELLNDDIAALVGHQYLVPAEGRDAVISPPIYAPPTNERKAYDVARLRAYNITRLPDGRKICLIDSIPSQSNRIEQIFKRPPYSSLIPQITIKIGNKDISILDVGHRAADTSVRYSTIGPEIQAAFEAFLRHDAVPLAKIAPISILFGAWDSRGTQAKLQRIVSAVIRAYDVEIVEQTSQYRAPINYAQEFSIEAEASKKFAQLGLVDTPVRAWRGGIIVQGYIRRDVILNLVVLRSLMAHDSLQTQALRRYILGLALVALSAPIPLNLREGCLLVIDQETPSAFEFVAHSGVRTPARIDHAEALAFAKQAAAEFGVGPDREAEFNPQALRADLEDSSRRTKKRQKKEKGE